MLRTALCAILCAVLAAHASCGFTVARLKYGGGGDWYANPSSLPNLLKAARDRTQLDICDTVTVVSISDERLFAHPFIYMTGHGNVHFTNEERVRLRQYLRAGGMLWADDNYGMDESLRRELNALFPENPLTPLASSHPLFSSRYALAALPKIHEHDGAPAQAFGIWLGDELVVLYTFSSDIGDGMEDPDVHNDGPELHELALRMGINVLSWFLRP